MNRLYRGSVSGEGICSVRNGTMCIAGGGVVGSALAGMDRKD